MKVRKCLYKKEAVTMASKDEIQKKYNELMGMSIGALDVDYAGVGRRVKEVRDQRGFTQSQLCDICNCDTTTLQHSAILRMVLQIYPSVCYIVSALHWVRISVIFLWTVRWPTLLQLLNRRQIRNGKNVPSSRWI